jgi:hypothetical protein
MQTARHERLTGDLRVASCRLAVIATVFLGRIAGAQELPEETDGGPPEEAPQAQPEAKPEAAPAVAPAVAPVAPMAQPQPAPQPDDEKKKTSALGDFRLKPPKVFGFIQVHYRHAFATGSNGAVDYDDFRVQRARVGVKGKVLPWVGYDIEIDPRAPEVTGILRDAFISVHVIPRHEIRIGQQKTQFGYENRESSTHLYAVNRTEVSDNLARGVTLRDIGLGLIGDIKLGHGWRIEDAFTVVNGNGMNTQADDTWLKSSWGRLGIRWKKGRLGGLDARLGVSGAYGDFIDTGDLDNDPSDDFRLKFKRVGGDLEIDHKWFFLSGEFVYGWDEDTKTHEKEQPLGYYANLVIKTPVNVGPIVRYDAATDFERWTFGAYYDLAFPEVPEVAFRLMVNYELRRNVDGERADDKLYVFAQLVF